MARQAMPSPLRHLRNLHRAQKVPIKALQQVNRAGDFGRPFHLVAERTGQRFGGLI